MLSLLLFTLSVAQAEEEIEDIKIFVKGLVCSFCVQGVEKQFKSQESVEEIVVDLHSSSVSLWLKDNTTISDEVITKLITDSGYNIESIERFNLETPTSAPQQIEAEKPKEAAPAPLSK